MSEVSSEPSMEDILASIKKIIAEDSTGKLSPAAPRKDPPPTQAAPEAEPVVAAASVEAEPEVLELAAPAPAEPAGQLVSEATSAASRNALQALSAMVVKPDITGSDTLEGMVKEMLRPMLKQWLDAKLPEVVEAAVAKEVARISGRTL